MGKQNPFLFKEISSTEHWRVPEIILSQCLKHPNRKIIEFTDGPEWTFKDLKIKSLRKARILKNLNLKAGDSLTVIDDPSPNKDEGGIYDLYCDEDDREPPPVPDDQDDTDADENNWIEEVWLFYYDYI